MKVFGWTKSFRGYTENNDQIQDGWQYGFEGTRRFLLQDDITDILVPARQWGCQLCIKLARAGTIRCALPDLQVDKELANYFFTIREHFLAVNLMVR